MTPARYGWRAVRWPLALLIVAALVLTMTDTDLRVARWMFFDVGHGHWPGAGNGWSGGVIHTGGRWLIRGIVAAAAVLWVSTFIRGRWLRWRRPAGYFVVATVLSTGLVGLLKQVTNVDCPWDLIPFGGQFPYIPLFADRPDALRLARCFPAAHASSGYALMALYFVGLERSRRWSRIGLAVGITTGLVFGIAQQLRGAHFLSHDLWSAVIVWCTALSAYCLLFRCRLWSSQCAVAAQVPEAGSDRCAGAAVLINMPGNSSRAAPLRLLAGIHLDRSNFIACRFAVPLAPRSRTAADLCRPGESCCRIRRSAGR